MGRLLHFLRFSVVSLIVMLIFMFCAPSTTLQNITDSNKIQMLRNVAENAKKAWDFARKGSSFSMFGSPQMHLAVVACGADDRVEETLVGLKSAVLFSKKLIKFHIFTEENLKEKFKNSLDQWPESAKSKFLYELYSINYPNDGNAAKWIKLFKLCASQRLFLSHILNDVDLLLYIDTDIVFLSPVDEIWEFFNQFNSTQLTAMAPEHEMKSVGWYNRFARHPYYGETGINSGVMLLNIDRVRRSKFKNDLQTEPLTWQDMMLPLYQKYKFNITFGDQDLLNIIFHHNPEMLKVFPCHWNYRPDHCMYSSLCKTAEEDGVKIMHGCRRAYHNEKWPTFKAVYSAVKSFDFNDDPSNLIQNVKSNIEATKFSNCKRSSDLLVNGLRNTVLKKEEL